MTSPAWLNPNRHQGYFAESLVASIAAAAGLDVYWPRLGDDNDLAVFRRGLNGTSSAKNMYLQVKSWSTGEVNVDGFFHFPLEVPAYNHLAATDNEGRHYLVLCIVPPDAGHYTVSEEASLTLHHSAYWLSLRDQRPDPTLNPDSRKIVYVPRVHRLTVETIQALVDGRESEAVVA